MAKKVKKSKKKKPKLKDFKIETVQGSRNIFFTRAENHKKALRRLETHSFDFKNCVDNNKNFTISIEELT